MVDIIRLNYNLSTLGKMVFILAQLGSQIAPHVDKLELNARRTEQRYV